MAFNFFRQSTNTVNTTIKINYDGKKAEKGLGSLTKTLKTVVSAYVIKQMATYTNELANLGAQAESVEKNFKNWAVTANKSTKEMMANLRSATLGMVNDMELQQRAMQAMVSGVSFDDIVVAMEFVTKFASATGTDVSAKMMTVMTGLARGSAQFLDDVGIQVMGSKDVVNDAIAQMKEKMDQFTTSEQDASVQARELKANFENLRITIGQKLVPAWSALVGVTNEYFEYFQKPRLTEVNREIKTLEMLIPHLEQQLAGPTMFEKFVDAIGGAAVLSRKQIMDMIRTAERELEGLKARKEAIVGGTEDKVDPKAFMRKRIADQRKLFDEEQRKIEEKKDKDLEKQSKKEDALLRKRNENAAKWLDAQTADVETHHNDVNEITQQEWEERNAIVNQAQRLILDDRASYYNDQFAMLEYYKERYNLTTEQYEALRTDIERQQSEERKQIAREEYQEKLNMAGQSLSSVATIANAISQIDNSITQKKLQNLESMNLNEAEYSKKREQILKDSQERTRAFARVQQGIAIAEAWVNVYKAAIGTYAETTGGLITRALAMGGAIAAGAVNVAKIQDQHFETGKIGIGGIEYSRQKDAIYSKIGRGESVISAPATAMHEDTLREINNNTANTARGISRMSGGGGQVNNFYGVSTEEMLSVRVDTSRRNRVGRQT